MARGEQLARQWRIIQTLLNSRRGKSAAEIADHVDCHPRTVYRDLEAISVAGFPIYTERVEGKNLWSLLDTVKHQLPVPFTLMELMALYFSRDMLGVFRGTVFHDALDALFKKVKATLPAQSIAYLDRLHQTLHVGFKPYKDYARFKEIINQVNEAAVEGRTVEMVYFTMSRKKETRRKVDPYRVWFFDGTFYLIGHCHVRGEVRIFALDRIKMLRRTDQHFEVPEGFDPEEFMGPSFGIFQGRPTRVRVWFSPEAASYIQEKTWVEGQVLSLREDGSLIFEARVAGTDEIRSWIMGWGSHARVLAPEILREEIRAEALAMAEAYGEGSLLAEQPAGPWAVPGRKPRAVD
ncbi:MAG: WYL domain-containing protein [Deltaproteobacteria bacterium]|nr:WYL domain-containing protein [Deltaproteobacteria bacterium]MBW1950247.1 WYL domain-containing protein [Deltaproteobacteria bacterium]MBW2008717.1 WYL domain-containing protein [Deltaproteobacteria bacterium]